MRVSALVPAEQSDVKQAIPFVQTDLGLLPADWKVVPASEICLLVVDCKNRTPPIVEAGGYAVVRTPNVRNGGFAREDLRFTDKKSFEIWTGRAVPRVGDVMITREAPLGEVCLVPSDIPVCLGQRMMLYRPDAEKTSSNYLLYALMSRAVQGNLQNKIGGSTVGHAKVDDIRFLQIPLPPTLAEQRAIADALSDANAWIGSLDALIAKKRDLKQAAMQQLLTGKTRLPGFEGEWNTRTLFELCGSRKDLFDDGDWIEAEHITDAGIRFIQTGNIGVGCFLDRDARKYVFEGSFAALGCREILPGDLLICRLADPAGRACVMPDLGERKMVTSVDVTIARPPADSADRAFLSYFLSTSNWFKLVTNRSGGTTHIRIARGALGKIKLTVPSIAEQVAIAHVLCDMDRELLVLVAQRDKARAIKQGIMQELLTGRIRLI